MNKVKEFIRELKENKRKKGLFSLGLWGIFLIIIYILMGGTNTVPKNIPVIDNNKSVVTSDILKNFENMKNYEYNYEIVLNTVNREYKYIVNGTYYNDLNYYNYNDHSYIIDDDNIYLVDNANEKLINLDGLNNDELSKIIDARMLNKNNLVLFLKSSDIVSETNYKDGSINKIYVYKDSTNKKIIFNVNAKNNVINSIDIDYSAYYIKFKNYKVRLDLTNINNIDNYNVNYNNYEKVSK